MADDASIEAPRALLIETCEELSRFLAGLGIPFWADRFLEAEQLLRAGDPAGLEAISSISGGLGGFTDLLVSPLNGHLITTEEAPAANARLFQLRETVFALVDSVRAG